MHISAMQNTMKFVGEKVKQCELHVVLSQSKSIGEQACYFLHLPQVIPFPNHLCLGDELQTVLCHDKVKATTTGLLWKGICVALISLE